MSSGIRPASCGQFGKGRDTSRTCEDSRAVASRSAEIAPVVTASQSTGPWPEGSEALQALQTWCVDEGVHPPDIDEHDPLAHRERQGSKEQLGFAMVTRPIKPGSAEWKSCKGQDAIQKEMNEHESRGTWNLNSVMELDDLPASKKSKNQDVIIGSVHPILGAKAAEINKTVAALEAALAEELRCRIVFTAPGAKTASGLDPKALYEVLGNAPITFQGSRALRAYAALKGWTISSRDAKSAYLQSKLNEPGEVETWVSLPAAYWPAHWHGKYKRPVVLLELSLYGHPKAGDRWDQRMCYCTGEAGFVKAPEWPSVFKHSVHKAAPGVYVDDFEMVLCLKQLNFGML